MARTLQITTTHATLSVKTENFYRYTVKKAADPIGDIEKSQSGKWLANWFNPSRGCYQETPFDTLKVAVQFLADVHFETPSAAEIEAADADAQASEQIATTHTERRAAEAEGEARLYVRWAYEKAANEEAARGELEAWECEHDYQDLTPEQEEQLEISAEKFRKEWSQATNSNNNLKDVCGYALFGGDGSYIGSRKAGSFEQSTTAININGAPVVIDSDHRSPNHPQAANAGWQEIAITPNADGVILYDVEREAIRAAVACERQMALDAALVEVNAQLAQEEQSAANTFTADLETARNHEGDSSDKIALAFTKYDLAREKLIARFNELYRAKLAAIDAEYSAIASRELSKLRDKYRNPYNMHLP